MAMMRIFVRLCAIVALIWLPVSASDIRASYMKKLTTYGRSYNLASISQQTVTSSEIRCSSVCLESSCVAYTWDPVNGDCRLQGTSKKILQATGGSVNVMLGDPQNYPMTSAKDCADILAEDPSSRNNVYLIKAGGRFIVPVWCDMNIGGWTTIMKRTTGSLDFNRDRAAYKEGFGDAFAEHWLGLDVIHAMTGTGTTYRVRADGNDWTGSAMMSLHRSFVVADEAQDYSVTLGAFLSGNGGGGLSDMDGMKFTTRDLDLDAIDDRNCAEYMNGGGWWYNNCGRCLPTAKYYSGGSYTSDKNDGIQWRSWAAHNDMYYSLKRILLKIKV